MKTDCVKIFWIDDKKDLHKYDAEIIEKRNRKIAIELYHPVEFLEKIENESLAKTEVDLFLVDYRLYEEEYQSKFYKGRGLSYVGHVREKYPDIPVYLFCVDKRAEIYSDGKYLAEREADLVLEYTDIQDRGHTILYWDAIYYRDIRTKIVKGLDQLIGLLSPPDDERRRIAFVIPEQLKDDHSEQHITRVEGGRSLDFAKYLRQTFLSEPGFVYDSLFASTSVGMIEKAFLSRRRSFQDAIYKGIFSKTYVKPLWWKSSLQRLLYQKAAKRFPINDESDVRRLAQRLFRLKEEECARCIVCGELYPDTIGMDQSTHEKKPVHYRCSAEDTGYTRKLYFEETRLFNIPGGRQV